jgi:hypothetical protein
LKCSIATCTTKDIISWKFLGKAKLDHLVCQSCSHFFENKTELLSSANVQKMLENVSTEHLSQTTRVKKANHSNQGKTKSITPTTTPTTRVKKATTHSNQGETKQNKVGQIGQEVSIMDGRVQWNGVITEVKRNAKTKAVKYDIEGYGVEYPDNIWVMEVSSVQAPMLGTDDFRLYYEAKKNKARAELASEASFAVVSGLGMEEGDCNAKGDESLEEVSDEPQATPPPTPPSPPSSSSSSLWCLAPTPMKERMEEAEMLKPMEGLEYSSEYTEWYGKCYEENERIIKERQPGLFVYDLTKKECEEFDNSFGQDEVGETKEAKEVAPTSLQEIHDLMAKANFNMDRAAIRKLMVQRTEFIQAKSIPSKSSVEHQYSSSSVSRSSLAQQSQQHHQIKVWCCGEITDTKTNTIRRCPHCYSSYGCSECWSKWFTKCSQNRKSKSCPTCNAVVGGFRNLILRTKLLKSAVSIQSLYRGYQARAELVPEASFAVGGLRMEEEEAECKANGDGLLGRIGGAAASNQQRNIIFLRPAVAVAQSNTAHVQPAPMYPQETVEKIVEDHSQEQKQFETSVLQERNRQREKLLTTLKKKKKKKKKMETSNNESSIRRLFTDEESKENHNSRTVV